MCRKIRIFTVILFAILIASCATDRIQIAQKEGLDCKTPESRYDYGRNKPIRAIKSNNRKYIRYAYRTDWRSAHNGNSAGNLIRKEKQPEKLIYGLGGAKNYHMPAYSGINELMFFKKIPNSSEINLYYYELKTLPEPARIIDEPGEINNSPSQENIIFPLNRANNETGYSYVFPMQEDTDEIMPDEFSDESLGSYLNNSKSDKSQNIPLHKSGNLILLLAALAGLIPFAAIKAKPKLARSISFWTAMNPWKTRFMYAGIQIALGGSGFLLGKQLVENGIQFSDLSKDLLLGVFLTSSLLYPVRYTSVKLFKHSYLRQKAFDLALALSGFMLMVNAGNNPEWTSSLMNMINLKGNEQSNVTMLIDHSQTPKQLVYFQNGNLLQDEKPVPQNRERGPGINILLTILAVLAALGLAYLLVLAACGLSCNGMEGLAYLVGIGGGLLLIGLAIWVIKSIWHPKHKRRPNPSEIPDPIQSEGTLQT